MDFERETRKLAERTEFSPYKAAEACNVSPRWVYKFLNGEARNPSLPHVQRLHDYLQSLQRKRKRRK